VRMTMTRPLALGMAARVRRIPARSTTLQTGTTTEHLQWWHKQAAKEQLTPPPVPCDTGDQNLYRFYSADGTLLYIGITANLPTRLKTHGRTQPWWDDVFRTTVEHFSCRSNVTAAEKAAIINEQPLYNRAHNWRRR